MSENIRKAKKLTSNLPIAFFILTAFSAQSAGATQANWQTTFSGTFNGQPKGADGGSSGFWGWCSFSGGTGSPAKSGTDSNCEVSTYFHSDGGNVGVHFKITGTAWNQELAFCGPNPPGSCVPPGVTPRDFFITAGSMTITGPLASFIIDQAGPQIIAAGCAISGQTVTCDLAVWSVVPPGCTPGISCLYSPDTGIPAAAGHYSIAKILENFGAELPPASHVNVQVNQLS